MPVLSRKWNFIYFLNPRTGSTMLEHVLIEELGGERFPAVSDHAEKMATKHLTLRDVRARRLLKKCELDGLIKVTSVRHPFAKAVSDWQGGKKFFRENKFPELRPENELAEHSESLEDYLRLILLAPLPNKLRFKLLHIVPNRAFSMLARIYGNLRRVNPRNHLKDPIDFVFRTEHLDEDFETFLALIKGPKKLSLPLINQTESINQSTDSYHTKLTKTWLTSMYSDILLTYYGES